MVIPADAVADETLDLAAIATLFGVDALDDEMRGFLAAAVKMLGPTVEQLRAALAAADLPEARYMAHAAQGAAESMGAASIAGLCALIDQALRAGDLAGAQARGGELRPQLEALTRRVEAL
jgi:HPt (histidine-containing phosphotransfer) domain-containing protein